MIGSQINMNGESQMTNDELYLDAIFAIRSFGFRHSFVIRDSSFVIHREVYHG